MVNPSHAPEPVFLPVSYGEMTPTQVAAVLRLAEKHVRENPRAKDPLTNAYRVINGQVVWIRQLEAALLQINTQVHDIHRLLETATGEIRELRAEVEALKVPRKRPPAAVRRRDTEKGKAVVKKLTRS